MSSPPIAVNPEPSDSMEVDGTQEEDGYDDQHDELATGEGSTVSTEDPPSTMDHTDTISPRLRPPSSRAVNPPLTASLSQKTRTARKARKSVSLTVLYRTPCMTGLL